MVEHMIKPDNTKNGLDKVTTKEEAVALCERLLQFDRPK